MLNDQILESLARNTPLREHLVSLVWPSLSTESKLQLIETLQGTDPMMETPYWLMQLAIDDEAAAVRYWAARNFHFKEGRGEDGPFQLGRKTAVEEKAMHAKGGADHEWMVRSCVAMDGYFPLEGLSHMAQRDRLLCLRNLSHPNLTSFVEWLDEAVSSGVPDHELRECAEEFFARPMVTEEVKRPKWDYLDGMDAHHAGTGVTVGWTVVRKAGPRLSSYLANYLPTSMGLGRITPQDLASMPALAIGWFGYRHDDNEQIRQALELIRAQPGKYGVDVQKAAGKAEEATHKFDAKAAEKRNLQQSIDKSQTMLNAVLAMKEQLDALSAKLQEVQAQVGKKRGIFG